MDLSHRYGETEALHQVSFRVMPGERFGVLGPNGGGKTTLFRILSTLLRPSGGRASVSGREVTEAPTTVRKQLGVVFQQVALDERLTISEGLRVQGALVGLSGHRLSERIGDVLRAFGLIDRAEDQVRTLSGGLTRRADLARGLLHRPPVLLLDEPTAGLDPLARRDLWDALDRLRRTSGTTQVVATHLMEEAERCDRIGILDRGRLVTLGAPADLKAELGKDTLWIDTPQPEKMARRLRETMGLAAEVAGSSVLVRHHDPAGVLPRVYALDESPRIEQVAVRQPTLEDVFAAATGRNL